MGGFVETGMACLFMILNTATIFGSAVLIAFGLAFTLGADNGWNLGLHHVGVFMGSMGGLILFVSLIGFMGTCGTSQCVTRMVPHIFLYYLYIQNHTKIVFMAPGHDNCHAV